MGFVLNVGHGMPEPGVCHLVLSDVLDSTNVIDSQNNNAGEQQVTRNRICFCKPILNNIKFAFSIMYVFQANCVAFVERNKLRTLESLGAVLWGQVYYVPYCLCA